MTIDQIPVKGGEPIPEGGSARYLSGEEINAIVAQIKENRTACAQISSILSSLTTIGNAITALQAADTEMLAKLRGISEHYNGESDPYLRKTFNIDSGANAMYKQANDWLDNQYFAIIDGVYYRGNTSGTYLDIDVTSVSESIIHIDLSGACVWVMNMPRAFGIGKFQQIAYGAARYSSSESGYEVVDGIMQGDGIYTRYSQHDVENQRVVWSEWTQIG